MGGEWSYVVTKVRVDLPGSLLPGRNWHQICHPGLDLYHYGRDNRSVIWRAIPVNRSYVTAWYSILGISCIVANCVQATVDLEYFDTCRYSGENQRSNDLLIATNGPSTSWEVPQKVVPLQTIQFKSTFIQRAKKLLIFLHWALGGTTFGALLKK